MDELIKVDKDFNKAMFISKVNNIFIMLHTAIMLNDLNRVKHFINDTLELKYEQLLNEYKQKNIRIIYDELNVKKTEIKNISINNNIITINVDIVSRCMEYFLDNTSGEYISGDNTKRIEKINHLVFQKQINASYNNTIRKCPTCGASMDTDNNGQCPYCKTIFNAEDYDWILISINN